MRSIYFDCYAGASGDMIVGALIDLGADPEKIRQQIETLGLSHYAIDVERVKRSGIAASKFNVTVDLGHQPARTMVQIREIIGRSATSNQVKERSLAVFERLALAEAKVHGSTPDHVHFHEVGAVDSIIDIVGAMIAIEMLEVDQFSASALRVGYGFVKTDHGMLPVPAPATAEVLAGVPIYAGDLEGEFVTPTGAAILAELCESFGPMPSIVPERTGYGAGSRDPKGFPNAMRLVLGRVSDQPRESLRVCVIETNIDDMNPQAYSLVMERAFEMGALDVFLTPVQMKKNRPAVVLTVICDPRDREQLTGLLLSETTSIGVRCHEAERRVLERSIETVSTAYGSIRVKVASEGGRALHFQPEYEDCARAARDSRVPLVEVQTAAIAAYREGNTKEGKQ